MKLGVILFSCLMTLSLTCFAKQHYGQSLCHEADYFCIKTKNHDSWHRLFPDPEQRDIIRRVNRMNIKLKAGMVLAIPKNIDRLSIYDVSPFPRYIDSSGQKTIYISQKHLAWGAYDDDGELLWWGPISSGANRCSGVSGKCHTPAGAFRVIRKQGIECISTAFPKRRNGENGGAPMPYCMHFFRGYAMHGSDKVPGYRASHGCIRLFTEDARWINQEFIDLPGGGYKGTRIIIDDVAK